MGQDDKDDFAARERVCESCVRPNEKQLGKSIQASRGPCARCGMPTVEGIVVRGTIHRTGKNAESVERAKRGHGRGRPPSLCPCGLSARDRQQQKHVCPGTAS
jgi:hypothetical protein